MRVACVEAVGDAPSRLVEHDALVPDRPLAGEGPLVQAQAPRRCHALTARAAEIRLGCPQLVPVGFRLHADPFDGDEPALDPRQLLDNAFRLVVTSFAEMVVVDDAIASTK